MKRVRRAVADSPDIRYGTSNDVRHDYRSFVTVRVDATRITYAVCRIISCCMQIAAALPLPCLQMSWIRQYIVGYDGNSV